MTYNISIDDYIGYWGYSKNYIRQQMSGLKNKPVAVRLSSMGGAVDDALDIRQQFIDHGDVSIYIYGYCASAATILATGAKKIYMSKYAFFLIHKVSNWVDAWGQYNADQLEQLIADLKQNKEENDKMDIVLANLYAQKCGKTVDEILPILKKGGWLNAEEAKDLGLVDEILEDGEKVNTLLINNKVNRLGLPELPVAKEDPAVDHTATDEHAPSWFQQFVNRFFHRDPSAEVLAQTTDDDVSAKAEAPAGEDNDTTTEQPNIQNEMKKDYLQVNSILQIEGLEFNADGKCNLTEDQVKAINARLAELEQTNGQQATQIDELNTQVENLKKGDGAETLHVNGGEGEEAPSDRANEMFNAFKNYL